MTQFQQLNKKFPFLSLAKYQDQEYIGIIQNSDKHIVGMYLLNMIKSEENKLKFLHLGEQWWWESNRQIPINIFLKEDFKEFRYCLRNFVSKEFKILSGPVVSMQAVVQRRVKRRQIQLVRKM